MGPCKYEHRGFKKAKERTWDSANLRTKTLREMNRKEDFGSMVLRKDFRCKVLKNCKGVRP
jgi:hypothetical protein